MNNELDEKRLFYLGPELYDRCSRGIGLTQKQLHERVQLLRKYIPDISLEDVIMHCFLWKKSSKRDLRTTEK